MIEVSVCEQQAIQPSESRAAPEELALSALAAIYHDAATASLDEEAWMAAVRGRHAGGGAEENQFEHRVGLSISSRAPQRRVKPPFFLVPSVVFGLQLFLDGLDLGAQRGRSLPVSPLRLVQKRLLPVDGLLPAFALVLPCGLFPCLLAFAALPLPFVCLRGLFVRRLFGLAEVSFAFRPAGFGADFFGPSWPRFFGNTACSPKAPSDPTGRLRTTPGFAIVAAMTSGSVLSVAAPWWKRLLSAPHASRAAFIEGAAIACSKKPRAVW